VLPFQMGLGAPFALLLGKVALEPTIGNQP
jgi:hypothetical protein